MNIRPSPLLLAPFAAGVLAFAVACGETTSDPAPVTPRSGEPSIDAAVTLSDSERAVVADFTEQSRGQTGEWTKFREEFDEWRAGLIDCHPSSARDALKDFAVEFKAVTEQARSLPRAPLTKDLADSLITAAQDEEAALRELRDRWQPNSVSLFELVEVKRTESGAAQKAAEDAVARMKRELEQDGEEKEEFGQALEALAGDWDSLHQEYHDLLVNLSALDMPDILTRLGVIGERLTEIEAALDELPASDGTESTVEALTGAAQAELSALRNLIDLLLSVGGPASPGSGDGESPPDDTRPSNGAAPDIETLFSEMNSRVEEAEEELTEARRRPATDIEGDLEQSLADLEEFLGGHLALVAEWDAFHDRYDQWRRTEGGCNRAEVARELAQFSVEVGKLTQKVRELPHLSHLLPIYDALVDAAEREEGAVRSLANSWQPFTVDAFKALDTERVTVDRLRRQAAIGLQELEGRFRVSSGGP